MKPYPIDLVSVVIPVYNEEASLPELLRRTEAACLELGRAFEIVLVDDGSRDRSAELLQAAAERDGSAVVAVILNRNYGQHAAILAGFEQSRGDLVITRRTRRRKSRAWWSAPRRATTWSAASAPSARTRPGGAGLRAW